MQTLEALQIKRKPRHPCLESKALMFLGFPLHAAGRPSDARGAHLFEIKVPMLFLQGTRDGGATELIEALVRRLGDRATLKLFQDAGHSFHVPARSGRSDAEVKAEMLDELAAWLEAVVLNLAESRRLRHVVGRVDTYRTKVELPSKMNSG